MTTPEQALAKMRAYVDSHRACQVVESMLEDDSDYFAVIRMDPPGTPVMVVGEGWVFVRKSDGLLRSEAPPLVLDKVDAMTPVE